MVEHKAIWLSESHLTRLHRVAVLERVRLLSTNEQLMARGLQDFRSPVKGLHCSSLKSLRRQCLRRPALIGTGLDRVSSKKAKGGGTSQRFKTTQKSRT